MWWNDRGPGRSRGTTALHVLVRLACQVLYVSSLGLHSPGLDAVLVAYRVSQERPMRGHKSPTTAGHHEIDHNDTPSYIAQRGVCCEWPCIAK